MAADKTDADALPLRRRAEKRLRRRAPATGAVASDPRRLLHELQVHQIELEMQNEALRAAQADTQRALQLLGDAHSLLEQRVAERTAELIRAREAAEAALGAKDRFLAHMSHELRTPMNGVLGMIELALGRASDGRQIDWLGKARRSGQHLLVVINDILDVTKLDAGRVSLARVDFRLDRLLEESTDLLAPVLAGKGLSFELDLPADLGRQTLRGDATRLQQIVLNLAGNAVKFTPRGGVIVRLREQEASATDVLLRVEVQDSGIGVAAPDQSRLFQAFEQVDPSSTRAFGGTGLGLAICARLVRLMGGEIGVASQAGVGSTFWFTARLEHSAAPNGPLPLARGSGAGERLRAGHAGARVLIAEDEPTNQELLCAMLEAVGLQLDVAGDGAAAVAMARATPYALILMDLQMPQLDGFAAARSIRALPERAHTPIVALTASAFDQDRQRCIEAGMDDHLGKPASAEQLYETLLKWLPRPAA